MDSPKILSALIAGVSLADSMRSGPLVMLLPVSPFVVASDP